MILSITGNALIVLPVSAGIACTLSLVNKVLHTLIINKYKKYKKHFEKDQVIKKFFDKIYRNSLQDKLFDKKGSESLSNIYTKCMEETKIESFL